MSGHDNGLSAGAYAPLADVDPPVVAHVLDLLLAADVAAYAEPFEGDRGPYQDVRPPRRPTLRVFVDQTQVGRAREVVAASLPGLRAAFLADVAARADRRDMQEAEVDAAWAGIVADYGRAPDSPVGPWPAIEDLPAEPGGGAAALPGTGLSSRLIRRADRPADPTPPPDDDAADDPVEHYVPPPPPPLPQPDTVTRFAWAGLVGGPLLLLLVTVFGVQLDRWVIVAAMAACCGGFVTLVARMHDGPRQDDGWDDGAVV